MSRRVDVYEVSRKVRTVEVDFVEFHQMMSPLARKDWQECPTPFRDVEDMPTYVRHIEPVGMLRTEDGATKYLAVGPELRELLEVHVKDQMIRNLESAKRQLQAEVNNLQSVNADIGRQFWLAKDQLDSKDRAERNFLEANVITRVWRAIRCRL